MAIVGNVIGSASSGGAKLPTVQNEAAPMSVFALRNAAVPVVGNMIGGSGGAPKMFILQNEDGQEIPVVLVGSEIVFTANANDIREGKIAASAHGVVTGTNVMPDYNYIYALINADNMCTGLFVGTVAISDSKFINITVYDRNYISKYYINGSWYEDPAGTIPLESSLI